MLESTPIGDVDLYYQDAGDGDPVVFLHGFGGNHLVWWQQVPALANAYRCIVPDQRLFGLSRDEDDGPGAAAFVSDLETLLDRLGVNRAAVVAQSMGGWTAASFATQHPDRVAALVLADTPGGLLPPEEWRAGREPDDEDRDGDSGSRAYSASLESEYAFLYDAISALNVHRPETFDAILPDLTALPTDPDRIAEAGFPVLMIVGEDDVLTPPAALRSVHERLPGAEFVVVTDAGHSVYFERPDEFNRLVADVLEEAIF